MAAIVISFLTAFLLTYLALPIIIRIARLQGLVDKPDERKSHDTITPSFGGIGIFCSFFIVVMLWVPPDMFHHIRYILLSLIIVFLVGALDDLDPISPLSKLLGQMIAVSILIFLADVRISSLYGIFGIHELPFLLSVFVSGILYIFIINSFNLIDGINGLASSIAVLTCSILGMWFYAVDYYAYSAIAFTIAGSTLAFLKFNITPAKIFMGDTGSLVLGTICSVLVIQFLEANNTLTGNNLVFQSGTSVALSILILPVFDTIRVFIYRIMHGTSPFSPDKNHIHHLLLEVGLTHMQATTTLLLVNVGFIVLGFQLQEVEPVVFILLALSLASILSVILSTSAKVKRRNVVRSR